MMDLEGFAFLVGEGAELLDEWTRAAPADPLAAASALRRRADARQSRWILEQVESRHRAVRKFGPTALRMLFTRKLLEQASGIDVARFKADRLARSLPEALDVADLCCGSGGDALALAGAGRRVHLVDLDPLALALASHNLSAWGLEAVSATASRLPGLPDGFRAQAFHLDPDRRTGGRQEAEDRWDNQGLSPDPEGIAQLVERFRDGAIKLPGAAPLEFLPIPGERQFLGVHDELREQVLWTGVLGRMDTLSVAEFRDGVWEEFATTRPDAEDAFSEELADSPGPYLHEPVKAMVRSHLFGAFGRDRGWARLDSSLAWLSGGEAASQLVKSYRVLAHGPLKAGVESALLREVGRSCGAVKKRGVAVVPEKAMKELRGLQGPPAILCYLRFRGAKWVAVVEPVGDST